MTADPDACAWCGCAQGDHGRRYHPDAGLHQYVTPTDPQRLARMRARRTARTTTEETP